MESVLSLCNGHIYFCTSVKMFTTRGVSIASIVYLLMMDAYAGGKLFSDLADMFFSIVVASYTVQNALRFTRYIFVHIKRFYTFKRDWSSYLLIGTRATPRIFAFWNSRLFWCWISFVVVNIYYNFGSVLAYRVGQTCELVVV